MTLRAASLAEIEIIKACILIAQEKGVLTARGDNGEECWGRSVYEDSGLRVDSTLTFYKPVVGFFELRVEENGILVFAASGSIDIASFSATQVSVHVPGDWVRRVFAK